MPLTIKPALICYNKKDELGYLYMITSSRQAIRDISGTELRAVATLEGLPPIVAMATQISTRQTENMVAFRGSGPIPPGLYHTVLTGEARPKPVTDKSKCSNIGPQAGQFTSDVRLRRYDLDTKTGKYKLRNEELPKGLDSRPLQLTLRDILNDTKPAGTKYQQVGDTKDGIFRFRQIDHPSEDVKKIEYSIKLGTGQPLSRAILANYNLVTNQFSSQGKELPDMKGELDCLYTVSAQHPGENPKEIQVLGGTVRDCDLDFMSEPTDEVMRRMLGVNKSDYEDFLQPLDMDAHHKETEEEQRAENMRALTEVIKMLGMLLEINQLKWKQYNELKKQGIKQDPDWEMKNIDKKPFIQEGATLGMMSAMVVTAGKGTPMQLYQALEINVIQQKLLEASTTDSLAKRVNMEDLDSIDPTVRNKALMKLHEVNIKYNKEIIARSFIQHPSECYNQHYTCPRGPSVLVQGDSIAIGIDRDMSRLIQHKNAYVPINPQWINKSDGSANAEIWVAHFLRNVDMYNKDQAVVDAVDKFLKDENNVEFTVKLRKELTTQSEQNGTPQERAKEGLAYLDEFLKHNPTVASKVNSQPEQKIESSHTLH